MHPLSAEERQVFITRFRNSTGDSERSAEEYLESTGWDYYSALDKWFETWGEEPNVYPWNRTGTRVGR